jgi:formylglycine-generating enzyme required for sulfatase activity
MKPTRLILIALSLSVSSVGSVGQTADPITNSIGMKLVRIEQGTFTMGQDGPPLSGNEKMAAHHEEFRAADWDEKPAHRVTITQPFHMATTEVTLGQFRQFEPDFRQGKGTDDEAVSGITWTQAVAFCEWLSRKEGKPYRLPTEAEWEYACRAGTDSIFHTGDTLPAGHLKWFGEQGRRSLYFPDGKFPPEYAWQQGAPSPRVGQTTPNAWGLHDMHGNVAEWCLDWYGPYESSEQTDPLGRSEGDFRVFRGGGHSMLAQLLRAANRSGWGPDSSLPWVGFRVVLGALPKGNTLPPPPAPLNAQHISQQAAKIVPQAADVPFMEGPRFYRRITEGEVGPLFARHNHSPGLAECPNGDLLAVWFSCITEPGPELCNAASRLRFGSKDWEAPSPFWDAPDVNDHAPKLWWDGDKTLFHLNFMHQAQNTYRTSTDNGATWSKAKLFPLSGEFGNSIIRTREGVLAISLDHRSLVISRDHGQTWTPTGKPRGQAEPRPGGSGPCIAGIHAPLVQLADGRLMALGRFDHVEDQERFGFKMPVSFSNDLGETWHYEASEFPVVSNTQRPVLLRLKEGPILLCSFTDQARELKKSPAKGMTFRSTEGEFTGVGLFAAISYDEGKTWPDRRLITKGNSAKADTNGYLALIQARDGRLHLLTSSKHYSFNLAWIKELPSAPKK